MACLPEVAIPLSRCLSCTVIQPMCALQPWLTGDEIDEAIEAALATTMDAAGNPATLSTVFLRPIREVRRGLIPASPILHPGHIYIWARLITLSILCALTRVLPCKALLRHPMARLKLASQEQLTSEKERLTYNQIRLIRTLKQQGVDWNSIILQDPVREGGSAEPF